MAASASTNPAAAVASVVVVLLLLALVVAAAGAREGQAAAPVPQEADDTRVFLNGPISAPAPEEGDGDETPADQFDRSVSTVEGPTQVLESAPVPLDADGDRTVSFDRTISRDSRRCDSDMRWNDQLCRTVCGMFKFHGYEFAEAVADEGKDVVPRCCCCRPGGAACNQL